MHIAFGFDIFYPETNGVITATINLARNLIDMGHKVWFFVPSNKGFTDNTIENGIQIVRIKAMPSGIYKGMKIIPIYGWYLYPYLKKFKIDIVHNTSPWLMGMSLNHAARRLHIPSIATHHTLIDNPIYIKYALKSETLSYAAQDAIWRVVFNPFYKLTWIATAPNKATCRQVSEKFPGLDVRYISNGIDISRFDDSRPILPLPEAIPEKWLGPETLLYVGRLGYEKAIDVTFDAFSICLRRNPNAKLIIIGRGPAENMLRRQITKLGIEDSVLMTGLIPNNQIIGSRILERVGAFVTASLSENQAITVIEALCSGAPVICANVENMTTLVHPDQGWYFRGGDIYDLAYKMEEAITNIEEQRKKAKNALKSRNLFDGRVVAKEFVKTYQDLLSMKKDGFYVAKGKERAERYMLSKEEKAEIKRMSKKEQKAEFKALRKKEKKDRKSLV